MGKYTAIKDLVEAPYALSRPLLEKLGGVFSELAARAPEYFATSKELPKGVSEEEARRFLGAKHNQYLRPEPDVYSGQYGGSLTNPLSIGTPGQAPALYMHELGALGQSTDDARWLYRHGRGQLNPSTRMYEIDASNAMPGTGGAKAAYPAAYEYILSQPDAANVVSALSLSNARKRPSAVAGMLEKYGDLANRRLLPDEAELGAGTSTPYGNSRMAESVKHLPGTEARLGLLNGLTARHAMDAVEFLRSDAEKVASSPYASEGLRLKADELRRNLGEGWEPTTDVPGYYVPELAQLLRDYARGRGFRNDGYTGPLYMVPGEDTLRRAMISNDVMKGLEAGDLDAQPYMTRKLARAAGGRVLGALGECSCGGRGHS